MARKIVELEYVENDTLPPVECTYIGPDGGPADITDFTFELHIAYATEPENINGTIVGDPLEGNFCFNFEVGNIR